MLISVHGRVATWPPRRRATIGAALLLAVVAVDTFYALGLGRWHDLFDLRIYAGAVRQWWHGGDLYAFGLPDMGRAWGFTYPPFAAVIMGPMAVLSWTTITVLQALASAVATTVVLTLILRGTAQRRGWWLPAVVAGADLLLLPLYPWASTLSYGQVNVLLVALVAVDLLAAVPRRHALAGVCIGLATAVKLTPALFVLYLLLIRERRAALTAAATAAFVTLASAALDPPASVDFWTSKVFEIQRIGEPSWVDNQSLNGALHRLLPHAATPLWAVAVVVVVSVWLWRLRRNEVTADPIAGFALTAVVACLISPVTWIYHLVWLIPAGAVLVDRMTAPTTPARRRIIALAAALGVYGLLGVQIAFSSVHGAAGLVLGNLLVLLCLALLAGLPLGRPEPVSARRQHPIARGSGRTEALRPSL